MPGGIGMFFRTQGTCSTVGITTGSKYSSENLPFFCSLHAKAFSWVLIRWCTNFSSSGHKNPVQLISIFSFLSSVYLSPGSKSGGWVGNIGSCAKGSLGIRRSMRNSSGSVVATGFILFSTFLYVFLALFAVTFFVVFS